LCSLFPTAPARLPQSVCTDSRLFACCHPASKQNLFVPETTPSLHPFLSLQSLFRWHLSLLPCDALRTCESVSPPYFPSMMCGFLLERHSLFSGRRSHGLRLRIVRALSSLQGHFMLLVATPYFAPHHTPKKNQTPPDLLPKPYVGALLYFRCLLARSARCGAPGRWGPCRVHVDTFLVLVAFGALLYRTLILGVEMCLHRFCLPQFRSFSTSPRSFLS